MVVAAVVVVLCRAAERTLPFRSELGAWGLGNFDSRRPNGLFGPCLVLNILHVELR